MTTTLTRETFCSDGQWNKYQELYKYFQLLMQMYSEGYRFQMDGEMWNIPFINESGELPEMGFMIDERCKLVFVGCTIDCEQNKVWLDYTAKQVHESLTIIKLEDIPWRLLRQRLVETESG